MLRNKLRKYKLEPKNQFRVDEEVFNIVKHPFEFYLIPNLEKYDYKSLLEVSTTMDSIKILEEFWNEIIHKQNFEK